MKLLLQEIRRNPLLWLLVFVSVALAAEKLNHEAHTLHFIPSVLAILPLAILLSHATESVAVKTGDSVGDLLNATLTASLATTSGRSAWFVGVITIMVYSIFVIALYLLPPTGTKLTSRQTSRYERVRVL